MREILFRGKSIETDKWVYGEYIKHINRTPCPMGDRVRKKDIDHIILYSGFSDWNMPRGIEGQHVNPDTVGQYTGLTDKNGKKIFEGDILRFGERKLRVYWNGEAFQWQCNMWDGNYRISAANIPGFVENWDNIDLAIIAAEPIITGKMTTEIIGNIWDNPELLEDAPNEESGIHF